MLHPDLVYVHKVLFQILLVCKSFLALGAGEVLLPLVDPLPVVLELARDPEPLGAEIAAQPGALTDHVPVGPLPVGIIYWLYKRANSMFFQNKKQKR